MRAKYTDSDFPKTASCPGNQHRAILGLEAIFPQLVDRKGSSKARCAQRHHFFEGQALRQENNPIGLYPGIFTEDAVVEHTQLVARGKNFLAGLETGCGG